MCGKLLRFPMDAINVFDVKGTIVGVGLRNPWTTAATGKDGERAIGNVGQDTSEDVFLVSTMDKANHNFGWPKYEGLLFRSAVAPYSASFSQAKIIFSDTDRAGLPRSILFVYYIVIFVLFSVGLGRAFFQEKREWFDLSCLIAFLTLSLPQMTFAEGYPGFDNGLIATEMRFLGPAASKKLYELYDEFFVMVVFQPLALLLLLFASIFRSRKAAVAGAVCGIVYLTMFIAVIQPPATITPLPVFAYVSIAAVLFASAASSDKAKYTSLPEL